MRTALDCSPEELDRQYETVRVALQAHEDELDPPLTVILTRAASDTLSPADLETALFTCRDALIDVLGVAADEPGVTWVYAQRRATEEAVCVAVTVREES
jgi:hypothetical protein